LFRHCIRSRVGMGGGGNGDGKAETVLLSVTPSPPAHCFTGERVNGYRCMFVAGAQSIVRAAYLLPVFNDALFTYTLIYTHTLEVFKLFYTSHLCTCSGKYTFDKKSKAI